MLHFVCLNTRGLSFEFAPTLHYIEYTSSSSSRSRSSLCITALHLRRDVDRKDFTKLCLIRTFVPFLWEEAPLTYSASQTSPEWPRWVLIKDFWKAFRCDGLMWDYREQQSNWRGVADENVFAESRQKNLWRFPPTSTTKCWFSLCWTHFALKLEP